MTTPATRQAFEAYRAAVNAEQALIDAVQLRDGIPTSVEIAEFDRLDAEINARKVEVETLAAANVPDTSDAASTITRIHNLGKAPTPAQSRDLQDAAERLLTASEGMDAYQVQHARDELSRAIKERNTADAATWAPELARLIKLQHRTREVDEARKPFARLFDKDDKVERMNTSTGPTIRSLWDGWRQYGFAGADFELSREYADYDTRALGSTGGSAVPTSFADFVIKYERTATPMLDPSIVRVINSSSGAPLTISRLTADPNHGGTVTAEAAAISELDPTISSIELGAYAYKTINLFSAELDQDNAIQLEDLLADSTGRELGLDIGVHLTTGDGSGKPYGFISEATNGGTALGTAQTGGASYFGWPDLVTLWGSVAAPYRTQGAFQVSPSAFLKILKFRDDNGQPILSLNAGGQPIILGRPVHENPAMAAAGSASKSVAFGDFSRYIVKRVAPVRVELSRSYKFDVDQVALKVVDRVDGRLADTAAVAYLVSANT